MGIFYRIRKSRLQIYSEFFLFLEIFAVDQLNHIQNEISGILKMTLIKQSNLSNIKLKFSNFGKNIYQQITEFPWISSILAVGVVLRVSGFVTGSIYYDELFSLQITHQGLFEMISSLRPNLSPPGFEVLLWVVTRIFGWNTFSLRLPSVLAGILSLWLVYN